MASLLKSRKFWITVFDLVVSTATYFIGRYVNPDIGNDIMWLIGSWQPVIVMLIYAIATEDAALSASGMAYDYDLKQVVYVAPEPLIEPEQ